MSSHPTLMYALAAVMGATGVSMMVVPQISSGSPVAGRAGPLPVTAEAATGPATTSAPETMTSASPATAAVASPADGAVPSSADAAAPSSAEGAAAFSADGVLPGSADGAAPSTTGPTASTAPPAPPPSTARTASRSGAGPPAKPVPTTTRPAAAPESQLDQVEAIATSSGWDWRGVHVHFKIGFYPTDCCHWGVYDPQDHKTIWIGPTAFENAARLRYVVLHELGHAWQWHTHRLKKLQADMAPWGYQDVDALEAGADCIATLWGADAAMGHYWTCPAPALDLMSRRLAGQWK